jgi:hypothetical protein
MPPSAFLRRVPPITLSRRCVLAIAMGIASHSSHGRSKGAPFQTRTSMIVPRYWSEARRQKRTHSRQVTVRRWGWSDESQEDADSMAAARAEEALARALADPNTLRREPKVPYNGAEGVPIREEIVGRHGTAVVTRNSYGARCLNTPDVLFADVDWRLAPGCGAIVAAYLIMIAIGWGILYAWDPGRWRNVFVEASFLAAIVLAIPLAYVVTRILHGGSERIKRAAINRVREFVDSHPRWNVRVYETPAGLRLVATHALFGPRSAEIDEFFRAMRVDPVYQRMCVRQNCFRARLSAKPWRCAIESHMKPRPGVWPVKPERMPDRMAWIDAYEERAAEFAACRFVESIGSGIVHPNVASVVKFHDDECRAVDSELPLA